MSTLDLVSKPLVDLSATVEAWLAEQAQVQPEHRIEWFSSASGPRSPGGHVRNLEHLTVLIAGLEQAGDFGVLEWEAPGRPWAQTLRTDDQWIVEVHDGTDSDYAQRVFRGEVGDYPEGPVDHPVHAIERWSPAGAATVMWTWLHGSLVSGYARTMRHVGPR